MGRVNAEKAAVGGQMCDSEVGCGCEVQWSAHIQTYGRCER